MKKSVKIILIDAVALLASLIVLIPFALIIINSLKNTEQANKLNLNLFGSSWGQMSKNYSEVFRNSGLMTGFYNSLMVTGLSVILVILVCAMGAFVLNRRKGKLVGFLNVFILSGLMLPFSIVACYFILHKMHLSGTIPGITLAYVAVMFPVTIFLYNGFYKSIPIEIDESAIIDGSGPYRLFFQVILPLLKPVTATVAINTFMSVWNDFGLSIFLLNSPHKFTAVLTTYSYYGQKSSDWNLLFANIILVSIPILIVYFFLQRYIVEGMTSGAVKG